jgi:hypothetical protein
MSLPPPSRSQLLQRVEKATNINARNFPMFFAMRLCDGEYWPWCKACNCWSAETHEVAKKHLSKCYSYIDNLELLEMLQQGGAGASGSQGVASGSQQVAAAGVSSTQDDDQDPPPPPKGPAPLNPKMPPPPPGLAVKARQAQPATGVSPAVAVPGGAAASSASSMSIQAELQAMMFRLQQLDQMQMQDQMHNDVCAMMNRVREMESRVRANSGQAP